VCPYRSNDHSWQVYFDTNRLIREAFGEAGYPSPMSVYPLSLVGGTHRRPAHAATKKAVRDEPPARPTSPGRRPR
jgi:small conductance mechanosensitive channel